MDQPSKNELARSCKIVQESCKNLACKTCTRYVPFLARFLHNLAHILQETVQDFARVAARIIIPAFLAHFLQDLARIGARLCKKRDILRASLACKILARFLHDLASSFLLGKERKTDNFYLTPLKKPRDDGVWYCITPIGHNLLSQTVKRLCQVACIISVVSRQITP